MPQGYKNLTGKQFAELESLRLKEELNDNQQEKLNYLTKKRDNFLNPPILSESAKMYLIEHYSRERFNLKRASSGNDMWFTLRKGFESEKEALELVSSIKGIECISPEEPISNNYISGKCDAIDKTRNMIVEIKTSWNAANFMGNRKNNKLSYYNWCQMQGYLDLYGLDSGELCFVLVKTPEKLIEQERVILLKKYTFGEIDSDKYEQEIENQSILYDYNKIPQSKRIITFHVEKDNDFIDYVYKRVDLAREFLNDFEKEFMLNKKIISLNKDHFDKSKEDNTEHNTAEPL